MMGAIPEIVVRTLSDRKVRAPDNSYPRLHLLGDNGKKHVLYEVRNWYETLLTVSSSLQSKTRGDGLPPSPTRPRPPPPPPPPLRETNRGTDTGGGGECVTVEKQLSDLRGSKKIPFEAYFVSVLYAAGLPKDSVAYILKNVGLLLNETGHEWLVARNTTDAFFSVTPIPDKSAAVLTLSGWNGLPARLVYADRRTTTVNWQEIRTGSGSTAAVATPRCVKSFLEKTLSGGAWVAGERAKALGKITDERKFYAELYECVAGEAVVAAASVDDEDIYADGRLNEYAWPDSQCVALPCGTDSKYRNVPLVTCYVHRKRVPLSKRQLKKVALTHLQWLLAGENTSSAANEETLRS